MGKLCYIIQYKMIIKIDTDQVCKIKLEFEGKRQFSQRYIDFREKVWMEKVKSGKKAGKEFWNGKLYTLEGIIQYDLSDITITLGECEYKDYIVKKSSGPKVIEKRYGRSYLQIHCGLGILPVTKDGKYIFGIKKTTVTLEKDILGYISGVFNKDEMVVKSFEDIRKFAHKELIEESNIVVDSDELEFMHLNLFNAYAEFMFMVRLDICSDELQGIQKDDEFNEFVVMTRKEVVDYKGSMLSGFSFLQRLWRDCD